MNSNDKTENFQSRVNILILSVQGSDCDSIKQVKLEKGVLHVTGKKKKQSKKIGEASNDGVKPIRIERRRAKYMRKFTLPQDANPEEVEGHLQGRGADSGCRENACEGAKAEENLYSNLINLKSYRLCYS